LQVKYRKIWEKISGSESENGLYVWRPIPPSPEFCAIGVICTKTNDEPSLEACRCVNKGWLVNVSQKVLGVLPCVRVFMYLIFLVKANQVWDDVGFGGKKGSIWSSPSAMKSMAVLTDGALILKNCLGSVSLISTSQANLLNSKISNLLRSWHLTGNTHFLSHA